MKSPELFGVIKIELKELINNNYKIENTDLNYYIVRQQYNQLFRQIKRIKGNIKNNIIKDVVFLDCKSYKNYEPELRYILENGFIINNTKYRFYGKSASMGRGGVIGFLSDSIYDEIDKVAMMGLKIEKTVLSKFEAYKHLMFSSCFCIEEKLPYMIVVDDYEKVIPNVHIKYVDEEEIPYKDKVTGEDKVFKQKVIKEGYKDIKINTNDGTGLCTLEIAERWGEYLELVKTPCAFMLRLPYVKGIVVAFDFKKYLKEKGITQIKDIWGKYHNIDKIDIVFTKSQYKGIKYFKKSGTYSDWLDYLKSLKKNHHCLGISKWNFSFEEEPKMQRINYQILQTLDITEDDIWEMSEYTRNWIEKILKGDLLYTYNYLGLHGEKVKASNNYMRAILLNPNMLNDLKVKYYLKGILEKTIDELKIGKMYVEGCFKMLIPDLIMLTEHIGGLEPKGILKAGEMYSKAHEGEYILNRNPHICKSEHVILNAVNNEVTKKWFSHIEGCCMINGYDITAPRLNGADMDKESLSLYMETYIE